MRHSMRTMGGSLSSCERTRMMGVPRRSASLLLITALLLVACAAPSPQASPATAPGRTEVRIVTGKPLSMARQNEPSALAGKFGGARSGLEEYARLFGASL